MVHVVFVHGWSVQNTDTYGQLPLYLKQQAAAGALDVSVNDVFLGKYVSFEDTVTVDDLARGFDAALRDHPVLGGLYTAGDKFACITHSTGGPVIRHWISRFYGSDLSQCPLTHLIMLAPANHGAALAQLGKSRLSRIKSYFEGSAPGQGVLNWLEFGSDESWDLNLRWMDYDAVRAGLYSFVLQGQTIDRKLYDTLNSYTDEMGSDGVVRVAGANMNYCLLQLKQTDGSLEVAGMKDSPATALAILPGLSHSGEDKGIIRSIILANAADHPTTQALLRCLSVSSIKSYNELRLEFEKESKKVQEDEEKTKAKVGLFTRTFTTHQCSMIVFRLVDDTGLPLLDYDVRITAGPDYDDNSLPAGFFIDRQRNLRDAGKLTYYVDYEVLIEGLNGKLKNCLGFDITARPASGLSHYEPARFEGTSADILKVLRPNQTLMLEITLRRRIDRQVFTVTDHLAPPEAIVTTATGKLVP